MEIELPFHELETSGPGAGSVNDLFKELAARCQVRRHAHPVGLWHAPSFQQFKFPVPHVSPGNLFSGSWIDQAGFVDTDVNAGLRVSGSGMVLDGISMDTIDFEDSEAATVPEMEVDGIFDMSPSGMVLDGTPTDTIDYEVSVAAVPFGCSSSVAASAFPGCSSSKVSSTVLDEAKGTKGVQFFVNYGNGVSSVVRSSSHAVVSDVLHLHADEYELCGARLVAMGCTLSQNGIGDCSNVQVLRRLRGGAGAYLDIPSQWECKVCGATRCWPAGKRCYKCDAPRDTVPNSPLMGLLGRPPQSRSSGPPTRSSGPRHIPSRNTGNGGDVTPPGAGVGPSPGGNEPGKKGEVSELLCRL